MPLSIIKKKGKKTDEIYSHAPGANVRESMTKTYSTQTQDDKTIAVRLDFVHRYL